ncbi:Ribosomal protein S21 [Carex littledalei]|uniref:Ribosomal protein S21 n=1 Tax=Carex littledalei TaxID=544730 RepID=A0A833QN40_9POAL|nr:Ribosomal protein S21 [Carex littledalei]
MMAVTSLNLLHLPFSTSAPSISSRQLPYHLPLKSQINNGNLLVCKSKNTGIYNVEMVLDEDDPSELYVNYFEREVARTGLAQEWRRRRFHENAKEERKRKSRDQARNRARERRRAGGKSARVYKRKYDDDYDYDDDDDNPDEAFLGTALDNLLDPEYQEGSLDLLEIDVPDEAWQPDGSGIFPVTN